jgi:hypothetical protein
MSSTSNPTRVGSLYLLFALAGPGAASSPADG